MSAPSDRAPVAEPQLGAARPSEARADRPLATLAPGAFRARCGACDVSFNSAADMDAHFRSDEHRVLSGAILSSTQRIQAALTEVLDEVRSVQLICAALTGRIHSLMTSIEDTHAAPAAAADSGPRA